MTTACSFDNPSSEEAKLQEAVQLVASKLDADILLFNAPIARPRAREVMDLVLERRKRPNILLILVTYGGDPDAAYLIAKCLQTYYKKFMFFVSGYCKSAGTLVAIGAHELIFSAYGELGPLDVQIWKKDEWDEQESGWAITVALDQLILKASSAFKSCLEAIIEETAGQITVPVSGKIAADLASGLLAPIAAQINPLTLGGIRRDLNIAMHYGSLLDQETKNLKPSALDYLIAGYSSHTFVIDSRQAKALFNNVRISDETEENLRNLIRAVTTIPESTQTRCAILFLSKEPEETAKGESEHGVNREAPEGTAGENASRLSVPGREEPPAIGQTKASA